MNFNQFLEGLSPEASNYKTASRDYENTVSKHIYQGQINDKLPSFLRKRYVKTSARTVFDKSKKLAKIRGKVPQDMNRDMQRSLAKGTAWSSSAEQKRDSQGIKRGLMAANPEFKRSDFNKKNESKTFKQFLDELSQEASNYKKVSRDYENTVTKNVYQSSMNDKLPSFLRKRRVKTSYKKVNQSSDKLDKAKSKVPTSSKRDIERDNTAGLADIFNSPGFGKTTQKRQRKGILRGLQAANPNDDYRKWKNESKTFKQFLEELSQAASQHRQAAREYEGAVAKGTYQARKKINPTKKSTDKFAKSKFNYHASKDLVPQTQKRQKARADSGTGLNKRFSKGLARGIVAAANEGVLSGASRGFKKLDKAYKRAQARSELPGDYKPDDHAPKLADRANAAEKVVPQKPDRAFQRSWDNRKRVDRYHKGIDRLKKRMRTEGVLSGASRAFLKQNREHGIQAQKKGYALEKGVQPSMKVKVKSAKAYMKGRRAYRVIPTSSERDDARDSTEDLSGYRANRRIAHSRFKGRLAANPKLTQ